MGQAVVAGLVVAFLCWTWGVYRVGGAVAAAPWKRRADELEGALRAAGDREAIELDRARLLELRVEGMRRSLARTLGLLRR